MLIVPELSCEESVRCTIISPVLSFEAENTFEADDMC